MKKTNRYTKYCNILMFLIFSLLSTSLLAQKRFPTYEKYIAQYHTLAVKQMKEHRIPASITLAQGLLESGAGNSRLAKVGNNHFGIKCHNEWNGKGIYKDDDHRNECFRHYKHAEESFEDHSKFLKRPRYTQLFSLKTTDYRGWAKGLQSAGYATDKTYANKLIKLIEDYELYRYDNAKLVEKKKGDKKPEKVQIEFKEYSNRVVNTHVPYKNQGLLYIVAKEGDTYAAIAKEFKLKEKNLYKYNEVPKKFPLKEGDIVYFQKKRSKAVKPNYEHVIKVGESMHSISQAYGMQVKNLYKMNKKDFEYVPEEGQVLRLR